MVTTNVPVDHPNFGRVIDCHCRQDESTERRRRYTELPPAWESRTFDSFQSRLDLTKPEREKLRVAFHAAKQFAEGDASFKWLCFVGTVGWGKTHLGAAILNARVEHPDWGPPGKYVTSPDLMKRLQRGFDDNTYQDTLEIYETAPLLLIDDVGTEYSKDAGDGLSWAAEQLFLILNHRYVHELPTIITSNTPADQIDVRVRDRLMDTGSGLCAVFAETLPSYRSGETLA